MGELYHAARMRLLDFLVDTVLPPRETELQVRGLTYEELAQRLLPVMRGEGARAVLSLFSYDDSLTQACILETKFEDNVSAAKLLGSALHEFLYEFLGECQSFDPLPPIIIPVPLSQERLKERGYNQTERVVRAALAEGSGSLGKQLHAEIRTDLLIRTRPTLPQTSLSGTTRRTNVAGAFAASVPCDPHRTYIVVDDVITTGNTMLAVCEALRAAGAKCLLPLTLAY